MQEGNSFPIHKLRYVTTINFYVLLLLKPCHDVFGVPKRMKCHINAIPEHSGCDDFKHLSAPLPNFNSTLLLRYQFRNIRIINLHNSMIITSLILAEHSPQHSNKLVRVPVFKKSDGVVHA